MNYPEWLCPQLQLMTNQPRLVLLGSGVDGPEDDEPPKRPFDMARSVRTRIAIARAKARRGAQARRELLWGK